jgi:hypothetical protein
MVYKKVRFPVKNSNAITYDERLNVESKFVCAGLCATEAAKCKGYFYDAVSRKCEKIDLTNASDQNVSFEKPIDGHLDYGLFFGMK